MYRAFVFIVMLLIATIAFGARKQSASNQPDPNAPPKDAQWTLYCQAIAGPAHVEQANATKAALLKATPLKDWYVIHQETQSVIYHGFYRAIHEGDRDKKDFERAQRDRRQIAAMTDRQGNRIFDQCFFVELDAPDPAAPPEWNLLNAPGYYTLEIGVYKDSPHRKEAAVDAVREARSRGIDAYYYHGETGSSVCIGSWPKSAVRGRADDEKGIVPESNDPDESMLVLPQSLPDQQNLDIRDRTGQRVSAYAPDYTPVDPSLIAMMEKYQTHAVNGETIVSTVEDPVTHEKKKIDDPSLVVKIPRAKSSILSAQQAPAPPPELAPPPKQSTQGGGKLKSVGN